MDKLETLKDLYEKGFISHSEYETRKTQIIDQLTNTKVNSNSNTNNKGMHYISVSDSDKQEVAAMLSKLSAVQLEPVFDIIKAHDPNQLRKQNNEFYFCLDLLDSQTIIEVRRYAIGVLDRINKKDLLVVDAHEYTPAEYPINTTLYPVITQPLLSINRDIPQESSFSYVPNDLDTTEYLNAGIEDVGDDLGYLPLIDPLTSETQSDNIMSLLDLEDIQGIQLPEELPYSPLEAPLLSPPSSAPSEQCCPETLSMGHLNHAERLQLQKILSSNGTLDLPLLTFKAPSPEPSFEALGSPPSVIKVEDEPPSDPITEDIPIGLSMLTSEPAETAGSVTGEPSGEQLGAAEQSKKIKIKVVIYRVEKGTGPKPWHCDAEGCTKSFSDSSNLLKHLRTHTKEKPYACPHDDCNKSFAHSSTLKEHINSHSGEKPFICSFKGCGKHFAQNSNLRRHSRIHTGDKPYVCQECGKSFSQNTNLKSHLALHGKNLGNKIEEEEMIDKK